MYILFSIIHQVCLTRVNIFAIALISFYANLEKSNQNLISSQKDFLELRFRVLHMELSSCFRLSHTQLFQLGLKDWIVGRGPYMTYYFIRKKKPHRNTHNNSLLVIFSKLKLFITVLPLILYMIWVHWGCFWFHSLIFKIQIKVFI